MKTTVKKLSDSRVEIEVTLDAKDLKPAKEKALEKLAKEIHVEGFRKGKVPAEVAKKFIPENDLNAETVDAAVRTTVIKAFSDNEKSPLVLPSVNVTKYVPDEVVEYTATADIIPEIKLGDYKKLGVKKEEAKVSERGIKEILDNIATSFAEKKTVKRAAKEGDEVIIDFVGKKDGEAFKGGTAKDYHLTLGSKTFIPGFEDGIIGHEPGDKFDLKLTFPKDYGVKDLAGAKTVFEVLLKQVNEITKPVIDDEMAKKRIIYLLKEGGNDDHVSMLIDLAIENDDDAFVRTLANQYKDDVSEERLKKILEYLSEKSNEENKKFIEKLVS